MSKVPCTRSVEHGSGVEMDGGTGPHAAREREKERERKTSLARGSELCHGERYRE